MNNAFGWEFKSINIDMRNITNHLEFNNLTTNIMQTIENHFKRDNNDKKIMQQIKHCN